MTVYLLPLFLVIIFLTAAIKKEKVYDKFLEGAKKAVPFVVSIFPYLAATLVMTALFEVSGLSDKLIDLLAGFFGFFGIPKELVPLMLIKPFSGAGSLSVVNEIFNKYGVDSYISRCAAVIYSSGETVFYVGAVYYSACKKKPPFLPFLIVLISSFISAAVGVLICKIL